MRAKTGLGVHNCEGYADRPQKIDLYVDHNQIRADRMESSGRVCKAERVTHNIKGGREDNKSSKGDENGAEELSKGCCKNAKEEHVVGGTKTGAGGKSRGRSEVRSQDDTSSVEQSQANLNGAEELSKGFCKNAKGEHEMGGTKTEPGVKNRGRTEVRSQNDTSSFEQSQAILNGEDSYSRGELAVMACSSREGDSEVFKDSEDVVSGEKITSHIQNKSLKDSSKQRRKCKYVVTDNAHYERDRSKARTSFQGGWSGESSGIHGEEQEHQQEESMTDCVL